MNDTPEMLLYDEDDEDYIDFQDYLREMEQNEETFEQILETHFLTLTTARSKLKDFSDWFGAFAGKISPDSAEKSVFCSALLKYISKNGFDCDALRAWCVCMSPNSYFLFEAPYNGADERYILTGFIRMSDDISRYTYRIKNEKAAFEQCKKLIGNISFTKEPVYELDFERFYHTLSVDCGIDGPAFEDNLRFASERICRSKELSRLMPLTFYVLLSRYRTKMLNNTGFEPNFKKIFSHKTYMIEKDNRKNIAAINGHIDVYEAMCTYFRDCDKFLCDAGFAVISNAAECSLAAWSDFPNFGRPLLNTLSDEVFTVFPNGLADNPFFARSNIDCDDIFNYEENEKRRAKKARICCFARSYITSHHELSDRYIRLVAEGAAYESLPLIMEIINNSEIEPALIRPEQVEKTYAVIMDILMEQISEKLKKELLNAIKPEMDKGTIRSASIS